MAENITVETKASVEKYLKGVKDPERQASCRAVAKLFEKVAKAKPKMWGAAIVGFGSYHYVGASGREGDFCAIAFAPRASSIALYGLSGGFNSDPAFAKTLGKFKKSGGCIHIKKWSDIDAKVLEKIAKTSLKMTYAIHTKSK